MQPEPNGYIEIAAFGQVSRWPLATDYDPRTEIDHDLAEVMVSADIAAAMNAARRVLLKIDPHEAAELHRRETGKALAGLGITPTDALEALHAAETAKTTNHPTPATEAPKTGAQAQETAPTPLAAQTAESPAQRAGREAAEAMIDQQAGRIPPAPAHTANPPEARPVLLATEAQIKAIYAIARGGHGWTDDQTDGEVSKRWPGNSPYTLTRRQASEFIDAIKTKPDTTPARGGRPGGKR